MAAMRRSIALLCIAVLLVAAVTSVAIAPLVELLVPAAVSSGVCGSRRIADAFVVQPALLILISTRHLPRASLIAAQR